MSVPLQDLLTLGALLFCVGLFGVLTRRNSVAILLSIELILNAANLTLVAFGRAIGGSAGDPGQVFAVFVIGLAAAEAVVGLGVILVIYRTAKTIFADELHLLKG